MMSVDNLTVAIDAGEAIFAQPGACQAPRLVAGGVAAHISLRTPADGCQSNLPRHEIAPKFLPLRILAQSHCNLK